MKHSRAFHLRLALVGVMVIVGLALIVANVWAAEFVINGGFESGLDSWTLVKDWDYQGGLAASSDEFHSGDFSLLITTSHGTVEALQVITSLVAGKPYTLSAWSFGDGVNSMTARVTGDMEDYCNFALPSSSEWSHSECVFTYTEDNPCPCTVAFYLGDYTFDGLGYIDDVSVVGEGGSSPPYNGSMNATTCLLWLLIKLSVAMAIFFTVVPFGMWLGGFNIASNRNEVTE